MKERRKSKGDVSWYLPNNKKAFAHSTKATSDLIVVLSEMNKTTQDVYNAINYDDEAKAIVKHFIEEGYGNYIFYDFVHVNPDLKYRKIENGIIEIIDLKDLKNHLDINLANEDYDYDFDDI